jgi:hypothetical protein
MILCQRITAIALLIALSLAVTLSFHRHGRPLRGVNAIERVVALESPRPWVTRVFPTLLVKTLVAATPGMVRDRSPRAPRLPFSRRA